MKNTKIEWNISKTIALSMLSLSIMLTGCGSNQTGDSNLADNGKNTGVAADIGNNQIVKNKEGIPVLRNKELGVDLPINVHTDWEVLDHGWAKSVIFYSDPYKQGYPPYEAGKSPDIEQVIYITNFEKDWSSNDDKFEGTWVGGLNERNHGKLIPSKKVNRNKVHTISAFSLRKPPKSGKYQVGIHFYTIPSATEAEIQDWQQKGLKDPITVALLHGWSDHKGYEQFHLFFDEDRTYVKIENNKLSIELFSASSKDGHLDMIYHPESDTMEITHLEFFSPFYQYYGDIANSFGLRKHNDVLKKYPYLDVDELMAGLIQMKIDQLKDAHPEFTGYKNLMREFEHEKTIPGSFNPDKMPTKEDTEKMLEDKKQRLRR